MRVAIMAPVWGRVPVVRIWWRAIRRVRAVWEAAGIETAAYVGGNEAEHRELCREQGGEWIEVHNRPLGAKANRIAEAAFRDGADYLFSLGSDDFVSSALAAAYVPYIEQRTPYVGPAGIYFFEPRTGRAVYLPRYPVGHPRHGEPVGAGRLLHRSLAEPRRFRPWPMDRDRGLDGGMTERLNRRRGSLIPVGPEAVLVDVKTETNIWSYDHIAQAFGVSRYQAAQGGPEVVAPATFLNALPEARAIRALGRKVAAA